MTLFGLLALVLVLAVIFWLLRVGGAPPEVIRIVAIVVAVILCLWVLQLFFGGSEIFNLRIGR